MNEAKKRNNQKALRELSEINIPGGSYTDVLKQRKWLIKFGGLHYGKSSVFHLLPKVLRMDEYSLLDLLWLALGSKLTLPLLWPQVFKTNLFKEVPNLHVPVYFMLGEHDYCTSTTLATEYYDALIAPSKKITFFENCGHNPFLETPNQFNQAVIQIKKDQE